MLERERLTNMRNQTNKRKSGGIESNSDPLLERATGITMDRSATMRLTNNTS
jgi:hypothetical protein